MRRMEGREYFVKMPFFFQPKEKKGGGGSDDLDGITGLSRRTDPEV